jgi:hypothetical protein
MWDVRFEMWVSERMKERKKERERERWIKNTFGRFFVPSRNEWRERVIVRNESPFCASSFLSWRKRSNVPNL